VAGCGPAVGRVYVGSQVPPYTATSKLRAFSAAYRRAFGAPPQGFAIYGYEQMSFLLAAINAAQSTNHATVVAALHRITRDSILGPLQVTSRGNLLRAPMYIYMLAGAQFTLAGNGKG
jgi:ABC-type branched-subunit amino acid transport system substrate-binding protein